MRSHTPVTIAWSLVLCVALAAASEAQTSAPTAGSNPVWTGAAYPMSRHVGIMLVHLDDAALAMAQSAQQHATSKTVKGLAIDIIAERSREVSQLKSAYQKQYGEAPPAWGPGMGYMRSGSGVHGSGNTRNNMMNGTGSNGVVGSGHGMMGASSSGNYGMAGGSEIGERSMMGQMMMSGDNYQMMMGNPSNWWGPGITADAGFVPALLRLDAMQMSMASLGLRSSDTETRNLSRSVVSARVAELARLSKLL